MSKHIKTDSATGERRCSCFKRCGGCQLDMPYKEQLEWKQSKAERMLSPFCKVQQIEPMQHPYNYRNKIQTVYRRSSSGRLISGVYQSSSRTVTAVDDCFLEDERAAGIVSELKRLFVSFKLMPYDEKTGRGLIRHTLIRTARQTGQIMLVIVTNKPMFPSKHNFVKVLLERCPQITTVVQNICDDPLPLTLGRRNAVLYGSGKIVDELCGCKFIISPASFYQVNPVQTEKLYKAAVRAAGIEEGSRVLDAYCGVGTIGMVCAGQGAQVLGVESNKDAVRDAIANAKLNGLDKVRVCGCRSADKRAGIQGRKARHGDNGSAESWRFAAVHQCCCFDRTEECGVCFLQNRNAGERSEGVQKMRLQGRAYSADRYVPAHNGHRDSGTAQ